MLWGAQQTGRGALRCLFFLSDLWTVRNSLLLCMSVHLQDAAEPRRVNTFPLKSVGRGSKSPGHGRQSSSPTNEKREWTKHPRRQVENILEKTDNLKVRDNKNTGALRRQVRRITALRSIVSVCVSQFWADTCSDRSSPSGTAVGRYEGIAGPDGQLTSASHKNRTATPVRGLFSSALQGTSVRMLPVVSVPCKPAGAAMSHKSQQPCTAQTPRRSCC